MKNYTRLIILLFMLIFSGFQCDEDFVTALSIVEAQAFSCSNSAISEIVVIQSGYENPVAVDTLFPDSQGNFTHQFTSFLQTYYLIPANQECSSDWVIIPLGEKSELKLKQTPLFEALKININLDPTLIDSLRIRIYSIPDIINSNGELVYSDPQNFDSGITTQWDTLPVSFILGEERNYSFITEIFPKTGSPSIKSEIIKIQDEPIIKTITF